MSEFYLNAAVRQRLIEFLGGDTLAHATAVYVTHSDGNPFDRRQLHPPQELHWFLDRGLDIARSLADTRSHLLHLDVEYVNFDSPGEAFVDPWRCFELQEPVVRAIETLLLGWGIRPLHVITGQGHHFVWRIARDTPLAARIRELNPAPELTDLCLSRIPPVLSGGIEEADQGFFAAVALLIEYVACRVKEMAAAHCKVPVEVTAVHVGPAATRQREMISVDISEYGDPLHTRMIRMPFTNYLKPWNTGLARRLGIENELPRILAIPLHEMDIRQAIKVRQVEAEVMELAGRACVRIPRQEEGTKRLFEDYLASRLRRMHAHYYSTRHDTRESWPATYGAMPLQDLPGCVRHLVLHPNDLLLKPAGMQLVTRALLALGWHPRHIAGLIRSKFENPAFGWGVDWSEYEPATRADFYVRLFACLHLSGLDRLVDFNCTSTREKGFCFPPDSETCSLEVARRHLLSLLPHE
jgi:hypothetical protein